MIVSPLKLLLKSMDSSQFEIFNNKLDKIIQLLEQINKTPKNKISIESTETIWSIDKYNDDKIIIKFSFNNDFKNKIKELDGKWIVSKKGWIFNNTRYKEIINKLNEHFPSWTCNNNFNEL
jgi:hypothetical protein